MSAARLTLLILTGAVLKTESHWPNGKSSTQWKIVSLTLSPHSNYLVTQFTLVNLTLNLQTPICWTDMNHTCLSIRRNCINQLLFLTPAGRHFFLGDIENLGLIDSLRDRLQSWMSTESQRIVTSRSELSHVTANSDTLMWEGWSSWFDRLLLPAVCGEPSGAFVEVDLSCVCAVFSIELSVLIEIFSPWQRLPCLDSRLFSSGANGRRIIGLT